MGVRVCVVLSILRLGIAIGAVIVLWFSGRSKRRCGGYGEGAPRSCTGPRCAGFRRRDQDRHVSAKHPAGDAADAAQDS